MQNCASTPHGALLLINLTIIMAHDGPQLWGTPWQRSNANLAQFSLCREARRMCFGTLHRCGRIGQNKWIDYRTLAEYLSMCSVHTVVSLGVAYDTEIISIIFVCEDFAFVEWSVSSPLIGQTILSSCLTLQTFYCNLTSINTVSTKSLECEHFVLYDRWRTTMLWGKLVLCDDQRAA